MQQNLHTKQKKKETKPTIINGTLIIIDLDTKPDIDTQLQDAAGTQTEPYDPTREGVRQTPAYSHPITRPPPRPQDLADRRNSRTDIGADPNLDFEENSPHTKGLLQKCM